MPDAVFTIYCPNTGHRVLIGCACEDADHPVEELGYHHDRCQMRNPTANLPCAGSVECCGELDQAGVHDCEAIANACPGGHGDCPVPAECPTHEPAKAHYKAMAAAHADHPPGVRHAFLDLAEPPEECPGGHCHKLIGDCTVHHPVIITAGLAAAVLRPVATS